MNRSLFFFCLKVIFILFVLCRGTNVFAQVPPIPVIDPSVISIPEKTNTEPVDLKNREKASELKATEEKVKKEIDEEKKKLKEEEEENDILALKRQTALPAAKIWGQNFFRDQSISLFVRSRDIKALPNYPLGAGDELSITVWGLVDFSKAVSVTTDGYLDISMPSVMIPRMYVKGMKFGEVQKLIGDRLANHMNMKGSYLDIQLNYSRNIVVNITGEVFNPGSYTIPAVNTAFNALVASNGPSQIGSVRNIKVVSSLQSTRTLDIYKFIMNPNIADEFFLNNNDYIYVPIANRVVEVTGAIKRPYFYELIEGENLIDALKFSGGLAADAYYRNLQIRRYTKDEEKIIDIDLSKLLIDSTDFKLENGDIITISTIKEAYSNFVTVQGAVKLPGEYELKPDIKIREVLVKSGIMLSAVKERIYVKRIQPDFSIKYININVDSIMYYPESESNILLNALDIIEVKFKSEYVDEYNIRLDGAVRKPGKYRHSDSLSLADLIYLGNGIKNEATKSIIEISRLIQKNDGTTSTEIYQFNIGDSLNISEADNFLLQPYDQVFVRLSRGFEFPKNVEISGEIFYPGLYTLVKKNERVSDLVTRAGGVTKIAFLEGAQLYRSGEGYVVLKLDEVLKNENSKYNYFLKEGDIITIPKIKDLVSISGRVNHPQIKENSQINEIELKVKIMKLKTEIEIEELMAQEKINQMRNPLKINVPFCKNKTADFYIDKYAGGIDYENGGREKLIYVRYPDGSVKKTKQFLFIKAYPRVEKGSMVFVDTYSRIKKLKDPNRKIINWESVIMRGFTLLTSTLTIYAIIRSVIAP